MHAIDVVTAGGELVRASAGEHADLFWAAQGAGPGFFGAVTAFHVGLHDLPRAIHTSTYVYPLAELRVLAGWLPELAARLDHTVELTALITAAAPPEAVSAAAEHPSVAMVAVAFAADDAAAASALAPLDTCPVLSRSLRVERRRPSSFDALYELIDGHFPVRHRTLADTIWSNDAPAHVLTAVQDLMAGAPSPRSRLLCILPPPPPPGAPPPDCALSMSAGFFVGAYAMWDDPAADAINTAWFRQLVAALEPYAIGHYIGESDVVAAPERCQRSFAPPHWQRLQALRRQWDPDGLFHTF